MKIEFIYKYTLLFAACLLGFNAMQAQAGGRSTELAKKFTEVTNEVANTSKYQLIEDTTAVKKFSNPVNIGIGLPMSTMGMNLVRNGLPVSPYIYPLIPLKVWSPDAGLIGGGQNDMGTTAIEYGMPGYTMAVEDNFGIPINKTILNFSTNDYGLLSPMASTAGEIGNSLTMYSATIKGNFDPGTYRSPISRYWKEQSIGARFALSKIYKKGGILGRVGILYAYHESKGHTFNTKVPFIYRKNGSVDYPNSMLPGRDSYLESSGTVQSLHPLTGKIDVMNVMDPKFRSHNIDFVNNTFFTNGWTWDTNLRFMYAKGGLIVNNPVAPLDAVPGRYTYMNGADYTGDGLFLGAFGINYDTPYQIWAGKTSLQKELGDHKMKLTLSDYYFNIDKHIGTSTFYFESLEANPRKLRPNNNWSAIIMDEHANIPVAHNTRLEYVDGFENKAALVLSETYEPNNKFIFNISGRLEQHILNGFYAPLRTEARVGNGLNPDHFKKINKTRYNKSFNANTVWKMHWSSKRNEKRTKEIITEYGVLASGGMLEKTPDLMAYVNGTPFDENVRNRIYNLELGAFYRKADFSFMTKVLYVNNTGLMETPNSNIISPYNPFVTALIQPVHDIQTLGWVSKIALDPFKGFRFNVGLTLQKSVYKNHSGEITFMDGNTMHYDYNNKYITGLSKAIVDVYASYLFNEERHRVWASMQYRNRPYANRSNLIRFEDQYDTAIGFTYYPIPFLAIDFSVKNLLNNVYPVGSLSYTDLMNQEQINKRVINKPIIAEYTMPLTSNLSITYIF